MSEKGGEGGGVNCPVDRLTPFDFPYGGGGGQEEHMIATGKQG